MGAITLDSFRRSVRNDYLQAEKAFKEAEKANNITALEKQNLLAEDKMNKLEGLISEANNKGNDYQNVKSKLDELKNSLESKGTKL